jgi:hypothetical protein
MDRALRAAADACFFLGSGDGARSLCEANVMYGVAKIRHVQACLGIEPDASFVAAPDATVSRNVERWNAGFGYGGRYEHSGEFVVVDLKTNLCGMLLVGLPTVPEPTGILDRARAFQDAPPLLDGVRIQWDLGSSNHFINLLESDQPVGGFSQLALIHGSGTEMRGDGPWGPGMYPAASAPLAEALEEIDTPWGSLRILRGEPAESYREGLLRIERFVHDRRELVARTLLGEDLTVLSNTTHQGTPEWGVYNLGCLIEPAGEVVPVALRADLPVYVVRASGSFSEEILRREGIAERARERGLYDRLTRSDLLPHGGGYAYPQFHSVDRVIVQDGRRFFEMKPARGEQREIVQHLRGQPFSYRGEEVIDELLRLELGEVLATARPTTVLTV